MARARHIYIYIYIKRKKETTPDSRISWNTRKFVFFFLFFSYSRFFRHHERHTTLTLIINLLVCKNARIVHPDVTYDVTFIYIYTYVYIYISCVSSSSSSPRLTARKLGGKKLPFLFLSQLL